MSQELDRLDQDYEAAEALFLDAVRRDAPRAEQANAARAVAIGSDCVPSKPAIADSTARRQKYAATSSATVAGKSGTDVSPTS